MFRLRRLLRFADGSRVTAASFAYAFNRMLSPALGSIGAEGLMDISGARAVAAGQAAKASGIIVRDASTLVIRLDRPVGDFAARLSLPVYCPLPVGTPLDPEGVGAPLSGGGPYYVSSLKPGQNLVLSRNPHYGGARAHHVQRFVVERVNSDTEKRRFEQGAYDWAPLYESVTELARRYGVNRRQLFVKPFPTVLYLVLNTQRPLFRNNVALRRAVSFAVNRRAILALYGPFAGNTTDQYLPPLVPGYRNEPIYPLKHADLARARRLARGHTRSGTAVLYTRASPVAVEVAQTIQRELAPIGLDVTIKSFPATLEVEKVQTRGEPFDMALAGWSMDYPDPYDFLQVLDGSTIRPYANADFSYFDSPPYNRLIARANSLPPGGARYRAFGRLDVELARRAAPMVALFHSNSAVLVSSRVGCLKFNARSPFDLTAVCLRPRPRP